METGRTKSGGYAVRFAGDDTWTEVSQEQYELAKSGTLERLASGAVNATQDIIGGAAELGAKGAGMLMRDKYAEARGEPSQPPPEMVQRLEQWGRETRQSNDPMQRINEQVNPAVAGIGSLAPDLAIGGVGGLARRPAMAIGLDAALGAAEYPEAPFTGAAVSAAASGLGAAVPYGVRAGREALSGTSAGAVRGKALADTAIAGATERGQRRAAIRAAEQAAESGDLLDNTGRAADLPEIAAGRIPPRDGLSPTDRGLRSIGAAENPDPSMIGSRKVLGDVLDSQELADQYGIPTSKSQATIIDSYDRGEFERARFEDKEDFERAKAGISGPADAVNRLFKPVDNYAALQAVQQRGLNQAVMAAMGDVNASAVTRSNVGRARKAISDSFNEIAERAGPIDMNADELMTVGQQIAEDIPDEYASNAVKRRVTALEKARDTKTGLIPIDKYMSIKNEIANDMANAYKNQSSLTVGDALRDLNEYLDMKLFNQLDPESKMDLKANRFKWGVANTALRTGAASKRGDVNINSFINGYRSGNNRFRIGYDDSEFAQFLDTMGAVMQKEGRDSGTPMGMATLAREFGKQVPVVGNFLQ